ncbi:MAG: hypothetical protein M1821_003175 [Bathelium mastoideum]|nr:MAG: hypothetical protein M1821_003175 [Bathelium mastoideum]
MSFTNNTANLDISLLLDSRAPASPPGDLSVKSRSSSPASLKAYRNFNTAAGACAYATPTSIAGSDYAASIGENGRHSRQHSQAGPAVANGFSHIHHRHSSSTSSLGPVVAAALANASTKRSVSADASPAKKQTKWTPEEDALNVQLRGNGMKWEDISKRLPGRSAISCRLRYQNYIERRSEWDEEKKNKLARLYERFKKEMWEKVAKELCMPYRAAEAMHWQLGEHEMASRANVPIFQLSNISTSVPSIPQNSTSASAPIMPTNYTGYPSSAGPSPLASPPSTMPALTPSHSRRNSYAMANARRRPDSVKIMPNDSPHLPWHQPCGHNDTRPPLKRPYSISESNIHAGYAQDYEDSRPFKRLQTPDSGGEEKELRRAQTDQ